MAGAAIVDSNQERDRTGENEGSFADREDYYFVGRSAELLRFRAYLEGRPEKRTLWSLSGTGGVGKTTLLAAFRRMAERAGAIFVLIDSGDMAHREDELCRRILAFLAVETYRLPGSEAKAAAWLDACVEALRERSKQGRVVLAFDTFEEFADMEGWLRERLFPRLADLVLLIVAGRHELGGAWSVSPAWRERWNPIPLESLSREEAAIYAERCGLSEDEEKERVWNSSLGHPLALSLATAHRTSVGAKADAVNSRAWFHEMADVWLKEATDPELRLLVEAAALPKRFHANLLAAALAVSDLPSGLFDRLIRISFIRKAERGWAMHDLMRDAVSAYLREREPDRYRAFAARLACYSADRILENAGKRNIGHEVGELYRYVGGETITAFYRDVGAAPLWEQVNSETVTEAEDYIRSRMAFADRIISVAAVDPDSGQQMSTAFPDALPKASLKGLNLRSWLETDSRSLFLLRGANREVAGLAAILPVHAGTLPYMAKDPFSAPYMATLSSAVRRSMAAKPDEPIGWFIRSIDYRDWTDPFSHNEIFSLMFSYICSGRLLLASPPPIDYFMRTHSRMGFEVAPGSEHGCYEGIPAPMLVLDTRGNRLARLLEQLMRRAGIPWRQSSEPSESGGWELLSAREREVARLVAEGLSNIDIATRLYVSEGTVKKHLSTVFEKLGLKRRSQLAVRLGLASGRYRQGERESW